MQIEKQSQIEQKKFQSRFGLRFKVISSLIVLCFIGQDIVSAQGGTPLWSKVTQSQESKAGSRENQLKQITIPADSGLTRKAVVSGTSDVIINIQDAHSKLGAQESITKILDNLVKNYNLNLIALEGASDLVDTSIVSSFPIEEVRKKTGQYLLKEGKISAGEFYSMITNDPVKLYGVDDPALYKENLEVFKSLVEKKSVIREQLKGLKRVIHDLEAKVYPTELLELTSRKLLHKNGDIKFTDYWDYFSNAAKAKGVDYTQYANLKKLADTVALEKEIEDR